MRLKSTIPVSQKDADSTGKVTAATTDSTVVGHYQVRLTVAVEVPDRDGKRTPTNSILRRHNEYSGLSNRWNCCKQADTNHEAESGAHKGLLTERIATVGAEFGAGASPSSARQLRSTLRHVNPQCRRKLGTTSYIVVRGRYDRWIYEV